jgi:hypothetical protein
MVVGLVFVESVLYWGWSSATVPEPKARIGGPVSFVEGNAMTVRFSKVAWQNSE